MVKSKPIEDARCSFLSVFGKVRKTGSNPASPAKYEKPESSCSQAFSLHLKNCLDVFVPNIKIIKRI